MEQTLSVAAIEKGTVIDHIPAGQGLRIIELLNLSRHKSTVSLGLNLPSASLGVKDLIKMEGRYLSEEEASQIALFAPRATLNFVQDYAIVKKFKAKLPSEIHQIFSCPNARCITNHESLSTHFSVSGKGGKVVLVCQFCEKGFIHGHH